MELIAYILHRRKVEGFMDSLAPASARDAVYVAGRGRRREAPAEVSPEAQEMQAFVNRTAP